MTLRDAGIVLIDCVHKTPPPSNVGLPYVAIPQLVGGRIDFSTARRITTEHFNEWTKKARPQEYDVVLSRRCNPGETAFVASGQEFAVGQNLVLLRADGRRVHPPFLRWLVRGPAWWDAIQKNLNVGAVFDSLKCADVPNFELPIPPIEIQRYISALLGSLDDKIEHNRKTSRALEGLARAMFKAWFVDFEPVHAKAAGATSFPGMPAEAFAALPTRFTDSELGPVPEGWRVGTIGQLVNVRGGATPSTKIVEYWEGGTHHWATPKDLSGLQDPVLLSTERRITDAAAECISSGVLPADTVLLSSRAPVGYLALAKVPVAVNQGFIAMVCDGPLPPHYTLHWTRSVLDEIKSRASGTTFPEISKTAFRPIPAIVPSAPVVAAFEGIARGLFDLITAHALECRKLAELRDYLLPKLLSGEVLLKTSERRAQNG